MHPLTGIKIIDITTMINGPFASRLLCDMGADVIRIEPEDGDPWRGMGGGFLSFNRGKRCLSINLKKPEAMPIMEKLVKQSDILVENARWGVFHKLGLDFETLSKINPSLNYLSVLGHGSAPPYSDQPGYDPLFQARSGQSAGQGGRGEPPVFHQLALNDVANPMLGAFGVALSLLARARNNNGKGQHIESSLTNASIALQSGEFMDYEGMEKKDLGSDRLVGTSALCRHYQAKDDRWIMLVCPRDIHWQNLCETLGTPGLTNDSRFINEEVRKENDSALAEILIDAFKTKTSDEWVEVLIANNVPASKGLVAEELFNDPHCLETDVFDERFHPLFKDVKQQGIITKLSETPGVIQRTAPLLGEHTEIVLAELGYSDQEIAKLIEDRVVFPYVPEEVE